MNFEKAYKPPKPFWAMSIPELVIYNKNVKDWMNIFLRKTIKNSSFWRVNNQKKKEEKQKRRNRKTRRRKIREPDVVENIYSKNVR